MIITGTIRSNILFGLYYDEDLYRKVVRTCQLEQDFRDFPKGDRTETGEMGL